MDESRPSGGPDSEEARLAALDERLRAVREREAARNQPKGHATDANYRLGSKVLAELLGGIGGGALVGWTIDRLAGTAPWGLLVMMFLGIIVAFRNIIRISGG
ncbi:MAG TPA: AtpZ/AtpI family protein [Novosphingobium sp.]|nr:AtpZ/AtpI family protein [Novosphingobium sp.]HZV09919.1 AtpZ/AtpI family protein [Novosphingobium sp.]